MRFGQSRRRRLLRLNFLFLLFVPGALLLRRSAERLSSCREDGSAVLGGNVLLSSTVSVLSRASAFRRLLLVLSDDGDGRFFFLVGLTLLRHETTTSPSVRELSGVDHCCEVFRSKD
jgi:hypothetical protein